VDAVDALWGEWIAVWGKRRYARTSALAARVGIAGRRCRRDLEAVCTRHGPPAILPAAGHFLPCARCALRHARFHPTLHGMQPTDDAICQLERLTSRRWRLFEDHRKGPLPGDTTVVSIKAHRGGAADNSARVSPDRARCDWYAAGSGPRSPWRSLLRSSQYVKRRRCAFPL
jgi:hypothetical protein